MTARRRVPGVAGGEGTPGGDAVRVLDRQGLTERGGQVLGRGGEVSGPAEHLTQHGQIPHHQRDARRQRLHGGKTETLLERRKREHVRRRDQRRQLVLAHLPQHHRFYGEFGGPRLPVRPVVAVVEERLAARDDQADVGTNGAQEGVGLQEVQ